MADIKVDSRYSVAEIPRDENGTEFVDWFGDIKFDVSDYEDNFEYEIQPVDTVFSIAERFYGDQKFYWVVCRANVILNPFLKLRSGVKIVLPSEKTFRSDILGQI